MPGGVTSQNFEAGFDTFDSQAADDFVVPAGQTWIVQQVNVIGEYSGGGGPAASVNVTFYSDSATLPGAAVAGGTYAAVPITTDTAGAFTIALPTSLVLTEGTYWVAVQTNMDLSFGQWFWDNRLVQSNSGAAWENPGDGFGTGCTTWGLKTTCVLPDKMVQINCSKS